MKHNLQVFRSAQVLTQRSPNGLRAIEIPDRGKDFWIKRNNFWIEIWTSSFKSGILKAGKGACPR
ncbi:MAG TPA: hypothetical protein VKD91_17435 [Pyrinomonadaceae bacterium]|nr:hypothetical protein [Pyrinomonadaceae bacterium]